MRTPALLVAAVATFAACDTTTALAPTDAPDLLIGGSPLLPVYQTVLDPATGIQVGAVLGVTVDVNKGLTNVGNADRFTIRTGASFFDLIDPRGDPVAVIDLKNDPLSTIDPMDQGLRQGGTVPLTVDLPVPTDAWLALLTHPGDLTAEADVSLILTTGAGTEKILDGVKTSGGIDPKGNPVTAAAGPPVLEAVQGPQGATVHQVSFEVFMPTAMADRLACDAFRFQVSAGFSVEANPLFLADPRPCPVRSVFPGDKDVSKVTLLLVLTAEEWTAIDGATTKPGQTVDVVGTLALEFIDADGNAVPIDEVTVTGLLDPKDDPNDPPAPQPTGEE